MCFFGILIDAQDGVIFGMKWQLNWTAKISQANMAYGCQANTLVLIPILSESPA